MSTKTIFDSYRTQTLTNPLSIYSPDPLQLKRVMFNLTLKENRDQVRLWAEDIREKIRSYREETRNGNA